MDYLDICGWKNCKQLSSTLFYNIAGLCDKHVEMWFKKKEAFLGTEESKIALLKLCSPLIKEEYKIQLNEIKLK